MSGRREVAGVLQYPDFEELVDDRNGDQDSAAEPDARDGPVRDSAIARTSRNSE